MVRILKLAALVLLGAAVHASAALAGSEVAREYTLGQSVPLDEEDLRNITAQVMRDHPILASAPGVKYASAQRSVRSTDIATIIYFPHTETAGVRQAFQVRCDRALSDSQWRCANPEIRRYLRLEQQEFEVRITGPIPNDAALAVIQASRQLARDRSPSGGPLYGTAIQVLPYGDGSYLVAWGTPEGYAQLAIRARIRSGGNPARPEDWQLVIFEPDEPDEPEAADAGQGTTTDSVTLQR